MLLCDGLVQHILIELCTQYNNDIEKLMKMNSKVYGINNSIAILTRAEGELERNMLQAISVHTIRKMLHSFAVGTERKIVAPN